MVEVAAVMELEINRNNSKLLKIETGRMDKIREMDTQSGSLEFEIVKEFVYLGALLTSNCDDSREINLEILKAKECAGSVNH